MSEPPHDVVLSAHALRHLREALRDETDALTAIHALHAAGFACGDDLYDQFVSETGGAQLDEGRFWTSLSGFFSNRGWGTLEHRAVHPGVGILASPDWAESHGAEESQPSCAFTAGMLSSFLTRAAGGGIAVLETSCRARGDAECAFAFGSEEAIHRLYGHLLEGAELDHALAEL